MDETEQDRKWAKWKENGEQMKWDGTGNIMEQDRNRVISPLVNVYHKKSLLTLWASRSRSLPILHNHRNMGSWSIQWQVHVHVHVHSATVVVVVVSAIKKHNTAYTSTCRCNCSGKVWLSYKDTRTQYCSAVADNGPMVGQGSASFGDTKQLSV